MDEIVVILNSGRTTEQGTSMEIGKTSKEYFNKVAVVELSPSDFESLGLDEGEPVEIKSEHGSIVVTSRTSLDLEKGEAFMPYGPWANRVYGSHTHGSGMPLLKGIEAKIRPARGGKVPSIAELLEDLKGG